MYDLKYTVSRLLHGYHKVFIRNKMRDMRIAACWVIGINTTALDQKDHSSCNLCRTKLPIQLPLI
jgi:hypothetical protein